MLNQQTPWLVLRSGFCAQSSAAAAAFIAKLQSHGKLLLACIEHMSYAAAVLQAFLQQNVLTLQMVLQSSPTNFHSEW